MVSETVDQNALANLLANLGNTSQNEKKIGNFNMVSETVDQNALAYLLANLGNTSQRLQTKSLTSESNPQEQRCHSNSPMLSQNMSHLHCPKRQFVSYCI